MNMLLKKYDRAVPRYTSFPTAVQFSDKVGIADYEACLRGLATDRPVSLYIHIPFCHSLCHYCGCHTKIVGSYEPVKHYFKDLHREIELIGAALPGRIPVERIHFGGGSPNFAVAGDLEDLLEALSIYWGITPRTQIDMESDPRLLNAEKIKSYARLGVTRVSLGVQDFHPDVQKAVNRIQPYDLIKRCAEDLRESGITQINFDLMTGLPCQTVETVTKTAQQAAELAPDRLAVFPYAHVPWMKKHQKLLERYDLPDIKTRFAMTQAVQDVLTARSYHEIGIDHFARTGDPLYTALRNQTLRRNFQGYTEDQAETIIGIGLSAISSFSDVYTQNIVDAPSYRKKLQEGNIPVQRGCRLSADDQRRRRLIEQIMCYFQVDLSCYPEIEIPEPELAALAQDGLIIWQDNILAVTETGKSFTRIIAACFDPYLNAQEKRHAKAV